MLLFFTIFYLIAEYMRPQSMYAPLANFPLAQIAVIGLGISFLKDGIKIQNKNIQNSFIIAFLLLMLLSTIFAKNWNLALDSLMDVSKIVIIYFLLINILNNRKFLYIFVFVLILLNFKYVQHAVRIWVGKGFHSDPRGLHEGGGFAPGLLKNPNDFGVLLNFMFGLSFYMIWADRNKFRNWINIKWFHILNVILIPIAILSTSSRGAMLAFGFVLFGIYLKSKKKILYIFPIILTFFLFITFMGADNWSRFQNMGGEKDVTGQSRIWLWKSGLRMANENLLIGVGPNNFVYVNTYIYKNGLYEVQHNIFIQAVSELGYTGLLILVGLILISFSNNRKIRKMLKEKNIQDPYLSGLSHGLDIAMIGFIVNGFFITVLYYPFLWTILTLNCSLHNIVTRHDIIKIPSHTNEMVNKIYVKKYSV